MIMDFSNGTSTIDAPQCTEGEQSTSAEDLFETASASDLLQSMSHDVNMYYMTDEELLGISAEQLPQRASAGESAQSADVPNTSIVDHLHGVVTESDTDVTHDTDVAPSDSQSSADVFLQPVPVTASTIFAMTSLANQNVQGSAANTSNPTQYVFNPFVQPMGQQRNLVRNPFAQEISNQTVRSPLRSLFTKPSNEAIRSLVRTPARITLVRQMSRSSNARSTPQNILLVDTSQSAFVPTSTSSVSKSTKAIHSVTHSNTVTSTTAVTPQIDTCLTRSITCSSHDSKILTSESSNISDTNTDAPASVASTGAQDGNDITSYTITDARNPFTVIVSQSEYDLTAARGSYLLSTINSRTPVFVPAAPSLHTSVSSSDRASAEFTIHPYDVTAGVSSYTSPTTVADATTRSLTRLIIPITYANSAGLSILTTNSLAVNTTTRPRCSYTVHPNQSTFDVTTDIASYSTPSTITNCTASSSGMFTISASQSANALTSTMSSSDSMTKINNTRSASLGVTVNTDDLSFFETATTASDVITTTHCPFTVAPTQIEHGISGSVSHKSITMASDPTTRPRNRLIIPIIQSANATTANLSYLLTSPTRSPLIISPSQSTHATTASLSSFISSTIRARTCNTLIIPQNATGFSYLTTSTVTTDSNKNNGPFTTTISQSLSPAENMLTTTASRSTNTRDSYTVAPTQSAYAITTFVSSNTASTNSSDRVTRSRAAATTTTQCAFGADVLPSLTTLTTTDVITTSRSPFQIAPTLSAYTVTSGISSLTSSVVASESTMVRNRLIIPVTQNTASTSLNLETITKFGSKLSTSPTRNKLNTSEDATSYTPSTVNSDTADFRSRLVIPITHSVNTTATACTSTSKSAVAADATLTKSYQFSVAQSSANADDSSSASSVDVASRFRNRLVIPTAQDECTTTDRTTSTVAAFTITRNRCPFSIAPTRSVFTIPAAVSAFASSELSSEISEQCQDHLTKQASHNVFGTSTTFISFATTTTASTTSANIRCSVSTTQSELSTPTSLCTVTTAAATLTPTGHRYIIKLSSQSPLVTTALNTVTAAVTTTPVTTLARSPSTDHQFLEPRPVPKLRTFPGPRTYSVSQRSCVANAQQRTPVRNVTPRAFNKKVISHPAPLQIFADVVCPPKATLNQTTSVVTSTQQPPRYTLSHSAGTSTLIVPQYKNTVFKNLSTVARPERANTRIAAPQTTASERIVIRRPVAYFSARRTFPCVQSVAQGTYTTNTVTQNTPSRPVRFTFGEIRSQISHTEAVSQRALAPTAAESPNTQTVSPPASDLQCNDEIVAKQDDQRF